MARTLRTVLAVTTLLAATAVTALPAAAETARPTRARAATEPATDADVRTLVATGTARVRGVPDVLTMALGVTSRADTVGAALDRNNAAIGKVMGVLTDGGVDEKDVQTSSFSIGPVYDDRSTKIVGYQVSNVLTVQLRDLAKAGALIDKAAQAGGDDVVMQGVAFSFDDASKLVAQARTEAVRRARTQAQQLAEAAGVELVAVRTISEASADPGPVLAAPDAATRDETAVAIAPGSQELSVQVTVVYTIR